jgi:hypothetical protein
MPEPPGYLITAMFTANAPFAEVFTVVGEQSVAVFA